jgi:ankyrin repeat protein
LVERGAALNSITKKSGTPLRLAARKGTLEVFHYLTEIGANDNVSCIAGDTVLHYKSASGNVEVLLDK